MTKFTSTYSGYPGGKKEETARDLLKRRPEVIIERAVKGMLPKNGLAARCIKNYLCMQVQNIRILHKNHKNLNFKHLSSIQIIDKK